MFVSRYGCMYACMYVCIEGNCAYKAVLDVYLCYMYLRNEHVYVCICVCLYVGIKGNSTYRAVHNVRLYIYPRNEHVCMYVCIEGACFRTKIHEAVVAKRNKDPLRTLVKIRPFRSSAKPCIFFHAENEVC